MNIIKVKVMDWDAKRFKSRDKALKKDEEEITNIHRNNAKGVFNEEEIIN